MVNDPIGDMLIQIKNAVLSRKRVIEVPYSKVKFAVSEILCKEGYLSRVEKTGSHPAFTLQLTMKFDNDIPALTDVKRKSKPGLRLYIKKQDIPRVVGGMGIAIISTPQGIMTGSEASKRNLGGELLCFVW